MEQLRHLSRLKPRIQLSLPVNPKITQLRLLAEHNGTLKSRNPRKPMTLKPALPDKSEVIAGPIKKRVATKYSVEQALKSTKKPEFTVVDFEAFDSPENFYQPVPSKDSKEFKLWELLEAGFIQEVEYKARKRILSHIEYQDAPKRYLLIGVRCL